ncbi:MAG TPA: hypothetical protein VJ989_09140 [Solirubrobacterales bacterium]|nr:hypothetical protein [Solirubrobacterales bacterium]
MVKPPLADLEDIRVVSDLVSSALTALAIVVGAIWAYWRFLRERTRWPRATLSLQFTERPLDSSTILLAGKLTVTNEGRGLMRLTDLRFDLHRIRPLDAEMQAKITAGCAHGSSGIDADWPLIEQRPRKWEKPERPELEPGESDEYDCDFFLDPAEETVFLYAYLRNEKKGKVRHRELGWQATAIYELSTNQGGAVWPRDSRR